MPTLCRGVKAGGGVKLPFNDSYAIELFGAWPGTESNRRHEAQSAKASNDKER